MQILNLDQRSKISNFLEKKDVSSFWDILSKSRKSEIFLNLSKEDQFEFITCDDSEKLDKTHR